MCVPFRVGVARPPPLPHQSSRQLFDFERVHLAPGASADVTFTVAQDTLRLVDKTSGNRVSTPGQYAIVFTNGAHNSAVATTVTLTGQEAVCEPFPTLPQ